MTDFTFDEYEKIFRSALSGGYKLVTVSDYFTKTYGSSEKILINRVDVDVKINRLEEFYSVYKRLGITASIYVRVHSPHYNLFTFDNIELLKRLISIGCEIGLHTELEDLDYYCKVDKELVLKQEIQILETLLGCKIYGTASHGDMTPSNNLNFWQNHSSHDFGLFYEAYDDALWRHCRYVSDSEWTRWKAYNNGELLKDDLRSPKEHIDEGVFRLYLLTHPESWYQHYIYEN